MISDELYLQNDEDNTIIQNRLAVLIVVLLYSAGLHANGPVSPFLLIDPVYYYSPYSGNLFGAEINFWPVLDNGHAAGFEAAWIFAGGGKEIYCDMEAALLITDSIIFGASTGFFDIGCYDKVTTP